MSMTANLSAGRNDNSSCISKNAVEGDVDRLVIKVNRNLWVPPKIEGLLQHRNENDPFQKPELRPTALRSTK